MALSATFTANFSSFYEAVTKADVMLKDFGEGADKVGKRLETLSNQFSGRRIVQEATMVAEAVERIGGVGALTDKELQRVGATVSDASEKMRKLGMEVPANFKAIEDAAAKSRKSTESWLGSLADFGTLVKGFLGLQVIQQVVGFGKEILADADALTKLSASTKISTDWLQKFQTGLDDAGGSIEDIAAGMFQLQKRLGSNDAALSDALKDIGLSVQQLRAMRPEEQFIAIADALHDIDDPARFAADGAAIFGKAFAALSPLIEHGMDDIKDAVVGMSQETVRALDTMGDAFSKMWRDIKAQGGTVIAFFYNALPAALDAVSLYTGQMHARAMARAKEIEQLGKDIDKQLADIEKKRGKGPGLPAALPVVAAPLDYEVRELEHSIEKLITTRTKDAEATAKQNKANAEAKQSIVEVEGVATMYAGQIRSNLKLFEQSTDQQKGWIKYLEQAQKDNADIGAKIRAQSSASLQADVRETSQFYEEQFAYLKKMPDAFVGPINQAESQFTKFGDFLATSLPASIISAVQGGGSVIRSIGSTIGNYLLDPQQSGIGKAIETGASKLPGLIGSAVGSVLPMAGALIGPAITGIQKLFGKMFGAEGKETNKLRDQFVEAAGGITALNVAAQNAGVTLDALLAQRTKKGLQTEIDALNEAFAFQSKALDEVRAAAERYGITLEELGPAMARGELDKQAQQLYQDFALLQSAGLDNVVITNRMADAVNNYIQTAVAMGIEVDAAMRPMLQQFADAGKLIDAQGNAITNLEDSGISFTMTMSEGFRALITEVQKLTDAISRSLGLAIKNIPQPQVQGRVSWQVDELPKSSGGARPMESYQEGTGGFKDFGAGTPVMLHGWEAVVPREDAGSFATVAAAAPAAAVVGGTTVVIHAEGAFFDTPGDLQRLADKVNDALTAKFGLRNSMRAA